MVAIRLSKMGRKKAPFYRIVAVDSEKKNAGIVLDILGTWNPKKKDFVLANEKFNEWVKKGAQVTSTVKKLIEKHLK